MSDGDKSERAKLSMTMGDSEFEWSGPMSLDMMTEAKFTKS